MRLLSILVLAGLPGSAMATDCPTRAELDQGATAYATYPDGGTVGLRWLGAGMIQETTRFPDGEGEFRMISMGGVFIIDEVNLDGDEELENSRILSRFPGGLHEKMPVRPDTEMTVTAMNRFADGTESEEEVIEMKSGSLAAITIAGCPYQGFPILLTYHWDADFFTSMMTHLPELGLSLELARMDPDGGTQPYAPERFSLTPP
ncbi:hypothetical protein R3X27_20355 [Tropicimonas sp. TH_r6]|uniref:hypothetical protein n=1 Tax=Tropicimonas sp. TH_r6 TaxID=3082085 RepID=UPI002953CF4C|nr:hypothetical protein [Tropicimonas sp. TH_r6]MDV7145039.1 hypothetical protein [Tropicimonas sp. TH_r6]